MKSTGDVSWEDYTALVNFLSTNTISLSKEPQHQKGGMSQQSRPMAISRNIFQFLMMCIRAPRTDVWYDDIQMLSPPGLQSTEVSEASQANPEDLMPPDHEQEVQELINRLDQLRQNQYVDVRQQLHINLQKSFGKAAGQWLQILSEDKVIKDGQEQSKLIPKSVHVVSKITVYKNIGAILPVVVLNPNGTYEIGQLTKVMLSGFPLKKFIPIHSQLAFNNINQQILLQLPLKMTTQDTYHYLLVYKSEVVFSAVPLFHQIYKIGDDILYPYHYVVFFDGTTSKVFKQDTSLSPELDALFISMNNEGTKKNIRYRLSSSDQSVVVLDDAYQLNCYDIYIPPENKGGRKYKAQSRHIKSSKA